MLTLAGFAAAAAVAYRHRESWVEALLLSGLTATATKLAVIDIKEQRLPNRIVLPLWVATAFATVSAASASGDWGRLGTASGLGLSLLLLMGLGWAAGLCRLGDVKYALPIGVAVGWLGPESVMAMTIAMTLASPAAGLVLAIRHRSLHARVPFGPILSFGLIAGLLP